MAPIHGCESIHHINIQLNFVEICHLLVRNENQFVHSAIAIAMIGETSNSLNSTILLDRLCQFQSQSMMADDDNVSRQKKMKKMKISFFFLLQRRKENMNFQFHYFLQTHEKHHRLLISRKLL